MKSLVIWTRSGVGDKGNLRMFFFKHPGELLVALDELWSPLFITHAHHFEIEGRRVSHLRPQTTPGTIDWTIGELNEVQGILDVRIQLVERGQLAGVELAGHAAIDDR